MKKLIKKQASLKRRKTRVRGKIKGSAERPRLNVTRSNNNLYVQFVDDVAGKTLCGISSLDPQLKEKKIKGSNVEGAKQLGDLAAKKANKCGITEVVFDRGGNLYHGRIKALAEACRAGGLKF